MGKPDLGRLIAQTMTPPAEDRTIETITGEILEAKRAGGEAILTIGRCLIEAKDMLRHGEWLPWLNEQVELSERTAQKFMKLAREWSNPNTLADLGASNLVQCNNKTDNVFLEYNGQRKTISDWARVTGIKVTTLYERAHAGWPVEEMLTMPPNFGNHKLRKRK